MNYYLDLSKAFVGQDVAIDPYRDYSPFLFAKVVKVTQNQVQVKLERDGEIARFSKVTARELNAPQWEDKRRLVSKDTAEARIAAKKKQQEIAKERSQIKDALRKLAEGGWTVDTLTQMAEVTDRIKYLMEWEEQV